MTDWSDFLASGVLVGVRVSGLMLLAPVFSSNAVAARIKVAFVFAVTVVLAPAAAAVPGARGVLDVPAVLGELGVGLVFGLALALLTEAVLLAATLLGMSFSFSLVNLLDPHTQVETPVLGQLLGWVNVLVLLGAGCHRTLLAAVFHSFCRVPVGTAVLAAASARTLVHTAGGIFTAGLELAAPVMAAALAVETTVAMVSRMAPTLPAQILGVPLKTMVSYTTLVASLAIWPGWIEQHFAALLEQGGRLVVRG